MRRMVLLVVACLSAGGMLQAEVTVVRNATILTVSHGEVQGSLLVRDGKIAAIGQFDTPDGAVEVDAQGGYLMPGIIDCHSHIAIEGGHNEASIPVSSMVDVRDVIDPEDVAFYRALAGGVTTVNLLHGSSNPIGGRTVVVKIRWGKRARQMLFQGALPGLKIALGENPKRHGSEGVGHPLTRLGIEATLREAFTEAQSCLATEDKCADDLKRAALVEVLEGKRYVHAHSYRADEILMLLRLADEFGFKVRTLQHALEGYKVIPEIAAHGAGVSTFSDWWSYKLEAFDAIPYNAALLMQGGVLTSLNSDDPELMRHLNQEAAKTLKYGGLSEQEALATITLNPARQLGIDQRVGSIDIGKDADLVLYDKHPLSNYARVKKVWIDGEVYYRED